MGKCTKCLRHNPTSKVAGCVLAKDCILLSKKHGYKLAVTDCPEYLAPEKVVKKKEVKEFETILPQMPKDYEGKKVR